MVRASRTFRIFVSSTFSDMKAERNALQQRVWPKLRELCMRHGCRFQAIDLRWGVSEEAALDQQTMNICLEEIRRCRRTTPRPNFVVLLGQRYGWRPLPAQIPAGEFEAILERISPDDRVLLLWQDSQPDDRKGWYRRDDNAVPPQYLLQPRRHGGPYEDGAAWAPVEAQLRQILLRAVQEMRLPDEARIKYERSATEQEIIEGALRAGTEHAFCYFRTIQGLPPDHGAPDLVDLSEPGRPDAEAQARLEDLKTRLRRHLPEHHVHGYGVAWAAGGIARDQLAPLCGRLEADLRRVILDEIGRLEAVDELDAEVEAHRAFGEERARHFVGRQEILGRVRDYVAGGDCHPLVIHGVSGSGKSALMARCVRLVQREHPEAVVVFRFLGATPASTDVRSLLESLCRQLGRAYGQEEPAVPTEHRELVEAFRRRLGAATPDKPLLVFLDALDQLSPADHAHTLQWLPAELAPHARIR